MKKILPIIVVLVMVLVAWMVFGASSAKQTNNVINQASPVNPVTGSVAESPNQDGSKAGSVASGSANNVLGNTEDEDLEGMDEEEIKPATQVYKSADDALNAVKKGSVDYDDTILEQFTQLGEECHWCEDFYKSVKELAFSPETKQDQRSYYAELLAISGRTEEIRSLVDAIKNAANNDEAELYTEAIELTIGDDDVVAYLGKELNGANDSLRESLVAAITNQGSRLAVETLYKQTVEKGDPDGFYSVGIGLGEVVPDDEALPLLQEITSKHDAYSHLGLKALLNSGLDGVKIAFDILSNSKNPEFDKEMIKGAAEHVSYEDSIVEYLNKTVTDGKNPVSVQFAKEILDEFALEEADDLEDEEVELGQSVDQ